MREIVDLVKNSWTPRIRDFFVVEKLTAKNPVIILTRSVVEEITGRPASKKCLKKNIFIHARYFPLQGIILVN